MTAANSSRPRVILPKNTAARARSTSAELQREYDATNAVTLEQVSAVTKKYARPEASSMLLIGDRSKIEAAVRDLTLGEIVLVDIEGKTVVAGTK